MRTQLRHREEVLNISLASCMGARGMDADPETILQGGAARPDVIAKFRGLRCGIEGKIADVTQAKVIVLGDARMRVDQGIAHLAIAVVYPRALRTADFRQLSEILNATQFEFVVLTEAGDGGWHSGGIDEILGELRRAHEVIVRDDVLQLAVGTLEVGLQEVANALLGSAATCDRLIDVLGVGGKPDAASV
jgi:hypothetical protein